MSVLRWYRLFRKHRFPGRERGAARRWCRQRRADRTSRASCICAAVARSTYGTGSEENRAPAAVPSLPLFTAILQAPGLGRRVLAPLRPGFLVFNFNTAFYQCVSRQSRVISSVSPVTPSRFHRGRTVPPGVVFQYY